MTVPVVPGDGQDMERQPKEGAEEELLEEELLGEELLLELAAPQVGSMSTQLRKLYP